MIWNELALEECKKIARLIGFDWPDDFEFIQFRGYEPNRMVLKHRQSEIFRELPFPCKDEYILKALKEIRDEIDAIMGDLYTN